MEINTKISPRRIKIFLFFSISLFFLVFFSYGKVMLKEQDTQRAPKIQRERGAILDRNGKILASQTTLYNVAVTKSAIPNKLYFAQALSSVLHLKEQEILESLENPSSDFFYLKKKITEYEKSAIDEVISKANLKGIRLESVVNRSYPENNLASHVVGFLGDDGFGLTGVEYSFQDILSPPVSDLTNSSIGYNVMLTIDATIQYELEKIARETMEDTQAEAVILLAAEATTGEILAYVSEPSANLNQFQKSTESQRFDRPAFYAYEPGSVFKIFSITTALELGLIKDSDIFYCDGAYTFTTPRGETVKINCLDRHGWLTAKDIIKFSCNDGTAQIVENIPSELFEQKIRELGFGSRVGIELPGESKGIFSSHEFWSLRSKPTIAMGQEISVTALQMLEAATALTNKGEKIDITLLSKIYTKEGELIYKHERKPGVQVISPENAALMLKYMEETSETGTGFRAAVGDVPMSVKTGTAQMKSSTGAGYSSEDFISSCIGIFPSDDPNIIIYLVIVKPVGETYGGRIAAPVISQASNVIIDYLGLGRGRATSVTHTGLIQIKKNQPVILSTYMPDLLGVSKKMLANLLERTDLIIRISGDGYVVKQSPEPGSIIEKGMIIELILE